jgi:hypothetical protein
MSATYNPKTFAGAAYTDEGGEPTLTLWERTEDGKRTKTVLVGTDARDTHALIKSTMAGASSPSPTTGATPKKAAKTKAKEG